MPELSVLDLIIRVVGAAVLGGLVGLEREFSEQVAGFRTHMIVSLGAALFTLAGAYGIADFAEATEIDIQFDPTRVAAQIVTGIGFLGAGAILRQGINVRGLTTAAALWVTAAIGLASGLGYWSGAIAVTIATIISLYALKAVERELLPRLKGDQARYSIRADEPFDLRDLLTALSDRGVSIERLRREEHGDGIREIALTVNVPKYSDVKEIGGIIAEVEGVQNVDWR